MIAALAVGFPLAIVLAWLFDLTAQGVERTPRLGYGRSSPSPRRRLLPLLVAAVARRVAAGSAGTPGSGRPSAAPATRGAGAQPSIAVLPFADMSPGKDQEYFGDGIAEEILNALAQVKGLR